MGRAAGNSAGLTVSYSEIAERIGAPKAVRAVAQACASNPIAVAIAIESCATMAIFGLSMGGRTQKCALGKEARDGNAASPNSDPTNAIRRAGRVARLAANHRELGLVRMRDRPGEC